MVRGSGPSVTVSIPHFRCNTFIATAVESILGQSYDKLTVVVVNDGDPDAPWEQLRHIDDPRLIQFDLDENYGRYFADDLVLRATPDTLFLIQDADDWSESDRIAELLEMLESEGSDAAFSAENQYVLKDDVLAFHQYKGFAGILRPLTELCVHRANHNALYRSSLLQMLGGYYGGFRIGYDTLVVNLVAMTGKVSHTSQPLYNTVLRANSLTHAEATTFGSPERERINSKLNELYARAFSSHRAVRCGQFDREDLRSSIRGITATHISPAHQEASQKYRIRLEQLFKQSREERTSHQVCGARALGSPIPAAPLLQDGTSRANMSGIIDHPSLNWNAWSISGRLAVNLQRRLKETRPTRILETGSGLSTVILAGYAAETGAKLVTLEHDRQYYEKTRKLLEEFDLRDAVELRLAPLRAMRFADERSQPWYNAQLSGSFDFLFVDGPPLRYGRGAALHAVAPCLSRSWELWLKDGKRSHERTCVEDWRNRFQLSAELTDYDHRGVWILRSQDRHPGDAEVVEVIASAASTRQKDAASERARKPDSRRICVNVLKERVNGGGSGALIQALQHSGSRVVATEQWDRSADVFFAVPVQDADERLAERTLGYFSSFHLDKKLLRIVPKLGAVVAHSANLATWLNRRTGRNADFVMSPGPDPEIALRQALPRRFTIAVFGHDQGPAPEALEDASGRSIAGQALYGTDRVIEIARALIGKNVVFRLGMSHRDGSQLHSALTRMGHIVEFAAGRNSVSALFDETDCLLVASRSEGGPMEALNCMAAGIPVVSTPVGEMADLSNWLWQDTEEAVAHLMQLRDEREQVFATRESIRARLNGRNRAEAGRALAAVLKEVAASPPFSIGNLTYRRFARSIPARDQLLSVLVTAWRTAPFIGDALRSLFSQELPPGWAMEVLVAVDDCADTLKAAASIEDPRLKIVDLASNGGTYRALNTLLKFARGDVIGILDSDDVALPERFVRQLDVLARRPDLDFVGGQMFETDIDLDGRRRFLVFPKDPSAALHSHDLCGSCHGTLTARRRFFHRVGGYDDTRVGGDWELILRAMALGLKGINLDEHLLLRRRRPDQLTRAAATGVGSPLLAAYWSRLRLDRQRYLDGKEPEPILQPAATPVRQIIRCPKPSVLTVMPTVPGRERSAVEVIRSILDQGPAKFVVLLNGHESADALPSDPRIEYRLNPKFTGSIARFDVDATPYDLVINVDDDIEYPPDYLHNCYREICRFGRGTAISYHGRYWPVRHPDCATPKVLHYGSGIRTVWEVPSIGAGVSAYPANFARLLSTPRPPIFAFEDDIWLSAVLCQAGIRLIRPATRANWLGVTPEGCALTSLYERAVAEEFKSRREAAHYARTVLGWTMCDRRWVGQ